MADVVVTIKFDLNCKDKCKSEYDLKKNNLPPPHHPSSSPYSLACKHVNPDDFTCNIGCEKADKGPVRFHTRCPYYQCKTKLCACYEEGTIKVSCGTDGKGGDGGSGAWSGHECGWAYKLWTVCQIGCDTKIPSFGNNGVIKANELCPYGKCDKNRCPCFLVGPISPYCQ